MKILLISVLVIIVVLIAVYAYFGGFNKIKIRVEERGGETIVFEEILGEYKQSGAVMDKIYYSLLNDYGVETYKGYGKYFDNPQKVEKSKLRSEAGSVIESQDVIKLDEINHGFKTKVLPLKKYIVSEFPYKGKISVFFSIMKVYPALNKYAIDNNLNEDTPITEIYDIPNGRILYRKEI